MFQLAFVCISFLMSIGSIVYPCDRFDTLRSSVSVSVFVEGESLAPNFCVWLEPSGAMMDVEGLDEIVDSDWKDLLALKNPVGGKPRPYVLLLVISDTSHTSVATIISEIFAINAAADPRRRTEIYIDFRGLTPR